MMVADGQMVALALISGTNLFAESAGQAMTTGTGKTVTRVDLCEAVTEGGTVADGVFCVR
jgi:hypothetical protein